MFEKQTLTIVGVVATGAGVVLTMLSKMVNLFSNDMSTMGAVVLAGMGGFLISTLILTIDNRIKMKKIMEGEK
ncbi:hypothetical protein [Haloarcula nitratireducens]|uniref:Uncharacterized protein n=1 Tax=Haloarcula nitratireducens TaxID=2487749 RepID=A0AAW4PCK2_9EURY|nr:hypothetical protein [Halomicroarcula nitratireducens]MBX0295436.1 hypothetical protein [Halomicroarcula nitratireducens]